MNRAEDHLEGTAGHRLYWQAWLPDGEPRAVVLLAHGLAEHSGRYAHVGAAFTKRGYALYAIDHRGHGRSAGKRTLIERLDGAVEDLHLLGALAAERHPGLAVFLLGHSMGGAIAYAYALKYQAELRGLVLSAPAVVIENVSPVTVALGKLVARVAPGAGILQLDGTAVSRDPEVVRRYDEDPLNYRGKVAARTAAELLQLAREAPARLPELKLPLLVVQGTADRLVSPKAAPLVHDRAGSSDKTIKTYEGLYHEVMNEPEQEEVLADILGWLDARAQVGREAGTSTSATP